MNPHQVFCLNLSCPARGQQGKGNIGVHSQLDFQSDGGYVPDADTTIVIWANSAENAVGQAGPQIANFVGAISAD